MRKIYLVDIGLLVVAGTMAAVLTSKPAHLETTANPDVAQQSDIDPKEWSSARDSEG